MIKATLLSKKIQAVVSYTYLYTLAWNTEGQLGYARRQISSTPRLKRYDLFHFAVGYLFAKIEIRD